jgi:hypothetical protein
VIVEAPASLQEPWGALQAAPSRLQTVELIGTHLRVAGEIDLGGFDRLSDYVSLQPGSVHLHAVTLLNRRGQLTADTLPQLVVRLKDLALITQRVAPRPQSSSPEVRVAKVARRIMAMTVGHVVEGTVSLYPGAELVAYLEASDPPFLALRDVRIRWLADRRLKASYDFALLNRAQIIAVSGLDDPTD